MYQLQNRKFQAGIFLSLLLLMSCNSTTNKHESVKTRDKATTTTIKEMVESNGPKTTVNMPEPGSPGSKDYPTCEAMIIELVKSSNAVALIDFKDVQVRTVDASPGEVNIELYTINEVSEDPSVQRLAERTVGWLEFFPATGKLQDITNDPDEPQPLQYDARILQKSGAAKLCP